MAPRTVALLAITILMLGLTTAPTRSGASGPSGTPGRPGVSDASGSRIVDGGGPGGTVEEVEVVAVVPVVKPKGSSGASGKGLSRLIGRFHPALVHFPIAWLVLLLLVELAALLPGRESAAEWGRWLAPLTLASFLPAGAAGFLRASELATRMAAAGSADAHRNAALVAFGLVLVATALRAWRGRELAGWARGLYLLLVVGALGTITAAGHMGGVLAHGAMPF